MNQYNFVSLDEVSSTDKGLILAAQELYEDMMRYIDNGIGIGDVEKVADIIERLRIIYKRLATESGILLALHASIRTRILRKDVLSYRESEEDSYLRGIFHSLLRMESRYWSDVLDFMRRMKWHRSIDMFLVPEFYTPPENLQMKAYTEILDNL